MSTKTTFFGPRVSFRTTGADTEATIVVDFNRDGAAESTHVLSRQTSSTASTANMEDGELGIFSVGNLQATLAFRSGSTIHTWASTGTIV